MDKLEPIRSMPFPALASALDLDLSHFKRRQNGEHYGPCPIHHSKQNQTCFSYAPDGKYHCFSCSAKGRGGIDLTMAVRDVNFTSACEFLGRAPQTSSPTKKEPVEAPVASGEVAEPTPLAKDTWQKFAVPCPWLTERIPDAAVRELYGVFCYNNPSRKSAWSGRVMLPVKDVDGVLYGYLGRRTPDNPASDTDPKYLFPKALPKSKFLFGADVLKAGTFGPAPLKRVWLVESPFACMKFAMWGIPAVSPFGWSVSTEQIALLAQLSKGVVYLPDSNKRDSIAPCCAEIAQKLWLRAPLLPEPLQDPELLSREQLLSL